MVGTMKSRPASQRCCQEPECETGLRNNYYEGKHLSVDSFRIEQDYSKERRRLLNRAIHGWGVVYGYKIPELKAADEVLEVGAGLTLDACGRELFQRETRIENKDVVFLDKEHKLIDAKNALAAFKKHEQKAGGEGYNRQRWQLSVHYAEQYASSVVVADRCRCERDEWDHVCETVRYSLQAVDHAECCNDFPCKLDCECDKGPCCGDAGSAESHKPQERGGCRCLCDHLTEFDPDPKCCKLSNVGNPRVSMDLQNGVPLACIDLVIDEEGGGWKFGKVFDDCGPRRLVKRNDLLFDLVRGCDLTRIRRVSWDEFHRREVPFVDFAKYFTTGDVKDGQVVTKFRVWFSRAVRPETLQDDCFAMTMLSRERDGGWWQPLRVPIVGVDSGEPNKYGFVWSAAIVVDEAWVKDSLLDYCTIFHGKKTRVELEVRGDLIVDCNGQTVDANAFGLTPYPTGNGTPGGTFLSTFTVRARDVSHDSEKQHDRKRGA